MLNALRNSLLSLTYPQQCRVCSRHVENHGDGIACAACWQESRLFDGSEMLCSKCGAYLGEKAVPVSVFCHQCDEHFYDRAVALGVYEKALAATILQLKRVPSLPKRPRMLILRGKTRLVFDKADLILPIPLSRSRRLERGFNQADLIAEVISRSFHIKIDKLSLTRKLHTPIHRIGMDRKARELTVKNAFEVTRPRLIDGKNIVLVDDVFTSGATASACAKVLKKCGAQTVNVFTLARAVMN
jgi:ComF family protein